MTSVGHGPVKKVSAPAALDRVDEALRLGESKRKVIDWNARYKSVAERFSKTLAYLAAK